MATAKEIWIVEWKSKNDLADDNWLPVTNDPVHFNKEVAELRLTEASENNARWHDHRITKYIPAED